MSNKIASNKNSTRAIPAPSATLHLLRTPAEIANAARDRLIEAANANRDQVTSITPRPDNTKHGHGQQWRGIFKLAEESHEVGQVLMKLAAFPSGVYPERESNLVESLIEELSHLQAAIDFFRKANGVPIMHEIYRRKMEIYEGYGLSGVDPEHTHNIDITLKVDMKEAAAGLDKLLDDVRNGRGYVPPITFNVNRVE